MLTAEDIKEKLHKMTAGLLFLCNLLKDKYSISVLTSQVLSM